MTIEAVTGLVHALAWPIVTLIAIALLRREVTSLFGRVREIEGPGELKLTLDPNKVEQIIIEGRKDNAPPAAVAQQIVSSAIVLDKRESRILRALLDDDGRAIYNYQSEYYRPSLEALIGKGYVQRLDKGFALTEEGRRATKEYILGILAQIEPAAKK